MKIAAKISNQGGHGQLFRIRRDHLQMATPISAKNRQTIN